MKNKNTTNNIPSDCTIDYLSAVFLDFLRQNYSSVTRISAHWSDHDDYLQELTDDFVAHCKQFQTSDNHLNQSIQDTAYTSPKPSPTISKGLSE